jgi:hypothetical protein
MIEAGKSYKLRNGCIIRISHLHSSGDPKYPKFWVADYVKPNVDGHYTCMEDGRYAPFGEHEHDIICLAE